MTVDPAKARARASHAGKEYFFCCQGCADKFRAAPEKYLAAGPSPMPAHGSMVQIGAGKPLATISPAPAAAAHKTPSAPAQPAAVEKAIHICPMDPEVRQDHAGTCPKCGMALEPAVPPAPATRVEYTCPMHPEIVRPEPGSCPICGMALEPRTVAVEEEENPELARMTRRFWVSVALTIPVILLGMSGMIPGQPLQQFLSMRAIGWIELLLATPVVLWGGFPSSSAAGPRSSIAA